MTPLSSATPESPFKVLEDEPLTIAPAVPRAADLKARRRVAAYPGQTRTYPFLLLASTAMAAVFCFMYITKPVVPLAPTLVLNPGPLAAKQPPTPEKTAPSATNMLPPADHLPGDTQGRPAAQHPQRSTPGHTLPPGTSEAPAFEETNLRVQHVLTAETPGGDLSRSVLNVPVLYQTRNLGWTANEVAEARTLLKRLSTYHEATRNLRDEGAQILAEWNRLIEHSIPATVLRADSPSLPTNQNDPDATRKPTGLDTTESIQIQPSEK